MVDLFAQRKVLFAEPLFIPFALIDVRSGSAPTSNVSVIIDERVVPD
jgi:hypothetical protein